MVEVVRLNFQRNWTTPGGFTICKSQLFKVINTGKTFSNVFISLQLTKNDAQCQNDVKSMPIKITSKKISKNNKHISTIEITSKKVSGNHVNFSTIVITSKKAHGNHVNFSAIEIAAKKVHGNHVDFSTIEITSKKVRGSNVDFSTIEITSKKRRGNHVDFSTSETTSKKYAEMTWKFVEIWSSTYRRNIHVESTWIRRGVPVGNRISS